MTAYFVINIELLHPLAAGGYCGGNYYYIPFLPFFWGGDEHPKMYPMKSQRSLVPDDTILRYEQHVEAALQGGATIKGQVMPHELVRKVALGRPRKNIW